MNKSILIVGATHGHEYIGVQVNKILKSLPIQKDSLYFEIGNPQALKKKTAFIESDLNRVFPGKENGNYEEILAYKLSKKIKKVDVVIDIHATDTIDSPAKDLMVIVTKWDKETRELIKVISPPNTVIMNYCSGGALISDAKIGLALEYGMNSDKTVLQKLLYDICTILSHFQVISNNPYRNPFSLPEKMKVFEVNDVYRKPNPFYILDKNIANFKKVNKGDILAYSQEGEKIIVDNDFIPILFGKNRYKEIFGFKGKLAEEIII